MAVLRPDAWGDTPKIPFLYIFMDNTTTQEFKKKLLAQKAELEAELAVVADRDVGEHVPGGYAPKFTNFGDDNSDDAGSDSPDEVQAYAVNIAVTKDVETHLAQVQAALARIEAGTYGKDIRTGEDISVERLRANPAAETNVPPHAA